MKYFATRTPFDCVVPHIRDISGEECPALFVAEKIVALCNREVAVRVQSCKSTISGCFLIYNFTWLSRIPFTIYTISKTTILQCLTTIYIITRLYQLVLFTTDTIITTSSMIWVRLWPTKNPVITIIDDYYKYKLNYNY